MNRDQLIVAAHGPTGLIGKVEDIRNARTVMVYWSKPSGDGEFKNTYLLYTHSTPLGPKCREERAFFHAFGGACDYASMF